MAKRKDEGGQESEAPVGAGGEQGVEDGPGQEASGEGVTTVGDGDPVPGEGSPEVGDLRAEPVPAREGEEDVVSEERQKFEGALRSFTDEFAERNPVAVAEPPSHKGGPGAPDDLGLERPERNEESFEEQSGHEGNITKTDPQSGEEV